MTNKALYNIISISKKLIFWCIHAPNYQYMQITAENIAAVASATDLNSL
jgi:hypothetical protein